MKFRFILLVTLLVTGQASADVDVNGFSNIVGGFTLDENETFGSYSDEVSYLEDSLFGLQVYSELDEEFSFTAQLMSRGNSEVGTNLEWAFITYQANDNLKFRFGRQRAPYFMYTEFADVGFAYHWITPPKGVYDLPLGVITGLNIAYDGSIGDIESQIQLTFGSEHSPIQFDGQQVDAAVDGLQSFAWTLNYGMLTLRTSQSNAKVGLAFEQLTPLLNGFRNPAFSALPQLAAAADALEYKDDDVTFSEFGWKIEIDEFQLIGEMTTFDSENNFTGEEESMYVSAIYRIDDLTFHYTYGEDKTTNDFSVLDDAPLGLDPNIDGLYALANQALADRIQESEYYTVGIRWDVTTSAAFKIDFTEFSDLLDETQDARVVRFAVSTYF